MTTPLYSMENKMTLALKPTTTKTPVGDKILIYVKEHECFGGFEIIRDSNKNRKYTDDQDILRGAYRVPFDYYPDFNGSWHILDVELNQEYEVISFDSVRNIEIIAICKTIKDI